jgi:hypothetical protein
MSPAEFANLPLHDAVLHELRVNWSDRKCVADLAAFVEGPSSMAQARRLIWTDVAEVIIPQRCPWGASAHVNSVREEKGWFVVEMQSGDLIRVAAANLELA